MSWKVINPEDDLQLAGAIEMRIRAAAESEAVERAIRGEIYRPAGGRSPSPSPVVPEQFRSEPAGARGGRPRDVAALLDEQLWGRARPSSLSSRILLGLVMMVPLSIVGVPALLIAAGVAGSIKSFAALFRTSVYLENQGRRGSVRPGRPSHRPGRR